jgi:acetolactate synthase I/II/III large subunit
MDDKLTGAQATLRAMLAHGLDHVFTVDSPPLRPLTEAMDAAAGDDLSLIRARDEIAAAAMADAFSYRSRRVSAVITGPGGRALAQVSAVTNAWADKVPVLSMSVCEDAAPDPNKGVERRRFDQTGVFREVTRWRARAESAAEIPALIARALAECQRAKTGPVHLDIPARLLHEAAPEGPGPDGEVTAGAVIRPLRMPGDPEAIKRAAALLMGSQHPLVFMGAGVMRSDAEDEVAAFLSRTGIPATHSMAGMGSIDSEHECFIGGPSYAAGEAFHQAIRKADCVLAIGTAMGGLEGFGQPPLWSGKIKFIHVDLDPLQLGLNVSPEVAIQGDVKTVIGQLVREMGDRPAPAEWRPWRESLVAARRARTERLLAEAYADWPMIHQGRLAHALGKKVAEDELLMVIDGGNTALYSAMYAPRIRPRQCFFPFGMAALGAGVPGAVGMQLAEPSRRVMLCTGDGSMLYNIQELETIADRELPIIIVVNNDSAWNMIRCAQTSMYAGNYVGTDLPDIDYAGIAAGFGFHAERVTRADEIVPAYERARASGKPAMLDVITDKTNYPDALISFALVEFGGVQMDPGNLIAGLWKSRTDGWTRAKNKIAYIRKSFFS